MKKIHVIPHTHWDREWYFTASRSKVYFCKYFKDIIETLENDEEFTYFTLDGQSSLLEDYLHWYPEDETRISNLVNEGKLLIGPWYTQSDLMMISGESILRNLYYGMKTCKKLGNFMKVGYVPDSFGQSGNMPQIYESFGIHETLFWRGTTDEHIAFTDFEWEGDDGTTIRSKQIPYSYALGGKIPEQEEDARRFWAQECMKIAGNRCISDHIYFPQGSDQFPIRKNLPYLLRKQNEYDQQNEYVISNPELYFLDVKKANIQLEKIKGELTYAKHCRIHKSIVSSRSDIKILNTKIQNYVTNVLEPMLAISYEMGHTYPHRIVEEIWKLLFENAAHDSAGSCCSDETNKDIETRYKKAFDLSVNLVELHCRLVSTRIHCCHDSEYTLTLFNTLPMPRSCVSIVQTYIPEGKFAIYDSSGNTVPYSILSKEDVSDYILAQTIRLNPSKELYVPKKAYAATLAIQVKQLPALGYEQYTLKLCEDTSVRLEPKQSLENKYYKISLNLNGTLNILDKQTNILYEQQCVIMDSGDDGDSFDYSPPRNDYIIRSDESATDIKFMMTGSPLYECATINFNMKLPHDLEDRVKHHCPIDTPIQLKIILKKDANVIDFEIALRNQSLSHRLCVLFDAQIKTKMNIADQPFGIVQRYNKHEKEMISYLKGFGIHSPCDSLEKLDIPNNATSTWEEPPISIEPTHSFVALASEKSGIALLPAGVREYEIRQGHSDQICLTLFRAYGTMGKSNLLYRPGRASGESIIKTKDAQLQKEMSFQFGFTSFGADINHANISMLAKIYHTDIQSYCYADYLNGRSIFTLGDEEKNLQNKATLMEYTCNLVVSAIKKWERGDGVIIRLYNGTNHIKLQDVISIHFNFKHVYIVDSNENITKELNISNNQVLIEGITHCQFITLLIT